MILAVRKPPCSPRVAPSSPPQGIPCPPFDSSFPSLPVGGWGTERAVCVCVCVSHTTTRGVAPSWAVWGPEINFLICKHKGVAGIAAGTCR